MAAVDETRHIAELYATVAGAAQSKVTCRHMLAEASGEEERALRGVCARLDEHWRAALSEGAAAPSDGLLQLLREEQRSVEVDMAQGREQLSALQSQSARWALPAQQLRELRSCVGECVAMRDRLAAAQREEASTLAARTEDELRRAEALDTAASGRALAAQRAENARLRAGIALHIERGVLREKITERSALLRALRCGTLPPAASSPPRKPRRDDVRALALASSSPTLLPAPGRLAFGGVAVAPSAASRRDVGYGAATTLRSTPSPPRTPVPPSGVEWAADWQRRDDVADAALRRRRAGMGLTQNERDAPIPPFGAGFADSTRSLVERILAGASTS